MSAFRFMRREHCNGVPTRGRMLASLHWPWSLTWRWAVYWHPPSPIVVNGRRYPRSYFLRTHRGRGINFMAGLRVPMLGHFSIHTQPNMRRRADSAAEQGEAK